MFPGSQYSASSKPMYNNNHTCYTIYIKKSNDVQTRNTRCCVFLYRWVATDIPTRRSLRKLHSTRREVFTPYSGKGSGRTAAALQQAMEHTTIICRGFAIGIRYMIIRIYVYDMVYLINDTQLRSLV